MFFVLEVFFASYTGPRWLWCWLLTALTVAGLADGLCCYPPQVVVVLAVDGTDSGWAG